MNVIYYSWVELYSFCVAVDLYHAMRRHTILCRPIVYIINGHPMGGRFTHRHYHQWLKEMLCHWTCICHLCVNPHTDTHAHIHGYTTAWVIHSVNFLQFPLLVLMVVAVLLLPVHLIQRQFPFRNLFQCVTQTQPSARALIHKELLYEKCSILLQVYDTISLYLCGINSLFIGNRALCVERWRKFQCTHPHEHAHAKRPINVGRIENGSVNANKRNLEQKTMHTRHEYWWWK